MSRGQRGSSPLLDVDNLKVQFPTDEGTVKAVDGVSFDVYEGETVCIVGESGSGKSVTSEAITRLILEENGKIPEGEVMFDGEDLTKVSKKRMREIRGNRIAHIFQNPQGSLNPVYTVGAQIAEGLKIHKDISKKAARKRAIDLLDRVGIPEATTRVDEYPHEFSGGMKQRVVIAMALANDPDLLIADEPTTALDVSIQAQILDLFDDLQEEFDMSVVFVTHDLGVVAEIADRVVVMYAGKVMETGDVFDVFEDPSHPYTKGLLDCRPGSGNIRNVIEGSLPSAIDPPDGCRFHPRCPHATEDCKKRDQPPMYDIRGRDQQASCVYYSDEYAGEVLDLEAGIGTGDTATTDGGEPR